MRNISRVLAEKDLLTARPKINNCWKYEKPVWGHTICYTQTFSLIIIQFSGNFPNCSPQTAVSDVNSELLFYKVISGVKGTTQGFFNRELSSYWGDSYWTNTKRMSKAKQSQQVFENFLTKFKSSTCSIGASRKFSLEFINYFFNCRYKLMNTICRFL